jgi:hypothetical protein
VAFAREASPQPVVAPEPLVQPTPAPPPTPPPAPAAPAAARVTPEPPPEPPLVAAAQAVLDRQAEKDVRAILEKGGLSAADAAAVYRIMARAAGGIGEGGQERLQPGDVAVRLDRLDRLAEVLRPWMPLALDRLCFCKAEVDRFGLFEALPAAVGGPAFQAGADGRPGERVVVYVEVRNVRSGWRDGDGDCQAVLASSLEIRDSQGLFVDLKDEHRRQLTRMHFKGHPDRSSSPRRDYFIAYQFHVPPGLPPGRYTLRVEVRDETPVPGSGPRTASGLLDFRVVENGGFPPTGRNP